MSFIQELKRRNVFRVAIAYVVVAWLVAQVLQLVFESFGTPDWVMKTVLVLMAAGFLFALFFAWAYEVTPQGIKRESELDRSQSFTHATSRKLDYVIIGLLVVALGYFAYDKFVLDPTRDAELVEATASGQVTESAASDTLGGDDPGKSIAVLPFVNMSDDESNEYFSDGISEELLNLLSKVSGLRVISRTSAFYYKGKDVKLPEIARELNVSHILDGSVRKAGEKVRITAQLIETDTQTHLWSETYDRSLDDIFAIQDEIAASVVDQLKIELLGPAPRVKEIDPMAYTLYLQARHLRKYGGTEGQQEANELLERAIAIEPEFSDALSTLAWRYQEEALAGRITFDEANAKSSKAHLEILQFDPEYAPSHAVLGHNALQTGDLDTAAAYIQRAYELNPTDATVLFNIANLLSLFGRLDEAIQVMEYLVTLDPVNDSAYLMLGEFYSESTQPGHAAKARDAMRTAMRLNPGSSFNRIWFGMLLLAQGEADAALEIASQTEDPEWWPGLGQMLRAMALYSLGRQEEYAMAVSGLAAPSGAYAFLNAAYVSAWAGEADQCFALLNLQLEKDPSLLYGSYWASPFFARVRDDPRWQPIRKQLGLSPEQIAAIDFEVTLPK